MKKPTAKFDPEAQALYIDLGVPEGVEVESEALEVEVTGTLLPHDPKPEVTLDYDPRTGELVGIEIL